MELASEKWGGRPHYRGEVHHVGDDEHGRWWWGPAGRTIYRGDQALFVTKEDALMLTPPGAWWAPSWWIGHAEVEVYVNINTPAVIDGERIVYVDLDLDVIGFLDGRVEVVDQDEFAIHLLQYGYPPDVIARAEQAAAEAFDLVTGKVPPFDGAAARAWAKKASGGGR